MFRLAVCWKSKKGLLFHRHGNDGGVLSVEDISSYMTVQKVLSIFYINILSTQFLLSDKKPKDYFALTDIIFEKNQETAKDTKRKGRCFTIKVISTGKNYQVFLKLYF